MSPGGVHTEKHRVLFGRCSAQFIGHGAWVQLVDTSAYNPLLIAADLDKIAVQIPWLGRKHLRLLFR